jgi:hypothetical protein
MYIFVVGGDGSKKTFVVDQDVPFRVHTVDSTAIFSPNTPSACRTLNTDPSLYFT